MSCNCIKQTTEKLISVNGPGSRLDTTINIKTGEERLPLRAEVPSKNADGEIIFKQGEMVKDKVAIVPTFCPFCGVQYE